MKNIQLAAALFLLALITAPAFAEPDDATPTDPTRNVSAHRAEPSRRRAPPAVISDPDAVLAVPPFVRPEYRVPVPEPTFGTILMRTSGTTGTSTAPVSGTWGSDARHGYSKRQPWNADQSLVVIENRVGGSPTTLFLDGKTFEPRFGPPSGYAKYDYRWHPSRAHASEQINVTSSGTELMWYDIVRKTKTRT